jgi:acetyltransferase-like isoleucine patch superfamily enzyme
MQWNTLRYRVLKLVRGSVYAARSAGVQIGDGCRIISSPVTTEPWLVSIGDRVTISSKVTLVTHDGSGWLFRDDRGRRYRYARIRIGSDVFIGAGAIIMPGVSIGDRCVVGAGSVVTKSIPEESVVAGNPARRVSDWESFHARLGQWASESDMAGSTYRERVDSIVDEGFRPPLG